MFESNVKAFIWQLSHSCVAHIMSNSFPLSPSPSPFSLFFSIFTGGLDAVGHPLSQRSALLQSQALSGDPTVPGKFIHETVTRSCAAVRLRDEAETGYRKGGGERRNENEQRAGWCSFSALCSRIGVACTEGLQKSQHIQKCTNPW